MGQTELWWQWSWKMNLQLNVEHSFKRMGYSIYLCLEYDRKQILVINVLPSEEICIASSGDSIVDKAFWSGVATRKDKWRAHILLNMLSSDCIAFSLSQSICFLLLSQNLPISLEFKISPHFSPLVVK